MKPYARLLSDYIGNDKVIEHVAEEWGVPRWVIDNGLSNNVKAPSAQYLPLVAAGLGMTVEEFVGKLSDEAGQRTTGEPSSPRKASAGIS
jgi:hypothetical protein